MQKEHHTIIMREFLKPSVSTISFHWYLTFSHLSCWIELSSNNEYYHFQAVRELRFPDLKPYTRPAKQIVTAEIKRRNVPLPVWVLQCKYSMSTLSPLACNTRGCFLFNLVGWGFLFLVAVPVMQHDPATILLFCSSCFKQQWWTDGGIKTHQTFTTSQTRPQRLTSEKSVHPYPPPHLSKNTITCTCACARTYTK